jgi:hypothetical protein
MAKASFMVEAATHVVADVVAPQLERAPPSLHEIRLAEAGFAVEDGDRLRLVLQVGVDRADVASARVRERGLPAFGDAAVDGVVHADDVRAGGGQGVDLRPGAVAAAVVHEHDLARDVAPVEDPLGALDQLREVALLVEARNEDAEFDLHGRTAAVRTSIRSIRPATTRRAAPQRRTQRKQA